MNLSEAKNNRKLGKLGESLAANYLQKRGFTIIERNFRVRYGEIDLVAKDADTLVFVEVKTRMSTQFGLPEEAITPKKLHEIIKTLEMYALRHHVQQMQLRIDAVAIQMNADYTVRDIRHIENIFS
ncbi:MAG: YraN family protein [Microgenomates group bacterium]